MDANEPTQDEAQPQQALTIPKRIVGRPFPKGVSGNPGGSPGRARSALNNATLIGLQKAFNKHGEKACMEVAKKKPDVFLKLLVLLVPREMEVTHKGGVKGMTDEQLEQGIEAIKAMIAARADGSQAQVIEGVAEPAAVTKPRKTRGPRKRVLTPRTPTLKPGRDDAMEVGDPLPSALPSDQE